MTTFLLALITVLFFPGVILRTKSLASGRKGPGVFQPWLNIWVLLQKGSVISETTSYLFRLAPVVYLATVLVGLILIPFPGEPNILGFRGDFVMLAYLLAFGKFLFILGALDTGSSFEGMGANREALYSMLAEPAFFILMGTMALLTGYTSMQEIFETFRFAGHSSFILGMVGVYLLVQIAMIENSRMPVDDPKTHLELTMIHEVMILDYSGFDLALMHIGTTLKFALYGGLIANFLIPGNWMVVWKIALFFGIQFCFSVLIGFLESFRARKKMARNPQYIVTLSSVALIGFILVILITYKMISE